MPEPFRRPGILIPLILTLVIGCAPRTSGLASPAASRSPSAAVSETSVRAHMEFLASDALNGRGSGTRDEWIAVTYVAAQLRQWGLEPMGDNGSYVQTIAIDRPELAAAPVLTAGDRRYTHGKEITVTSMNAPSMSGTIADVKAGESAAAGTVVVIPEFTRALAPSLAKAELVLANANGCGGFRGQQGGLPRVAPTTVGAAAAPARPTCVGLDAQTFAAVEKLPAGTRVSLEAPVKQTQRTHTWNAVGRLAGNGPRANDEVILLSAHIDHLGTGRPSASSGQAAAAGDTIYNGADDDASGSVAVLELAQAMASGRRAKRTVVFAWFGSEESGGAGARYFADKPVVPLDHIVANLQFEMIGRPDAKVPAHTLWLTGFERSTLGPELAKRGAKLVQDPHPEQNFFERSDNIQFARRGVVAHTVSSFGLHKDYHQASDEIDTIDFAHMTDAIRSMVQPVWWLANADFRPDWLPGKKP